LPAIASGAKKADSSKHIAGLIGDAGMLAAHDACHRQRFV
jgi:hypothetical protein